MPKRIGNSQTPSAAGVTDLINLKQHKNFVDQDIFPSTDNHVVNSLLFNGSSYLSRSITGGNDEIHTISVWIKRTKLTGSGHTDGILSAGAPGNSNRIFLLSFNVNEKLEMWGFSPDASNIRWQRTTDAVFRDLNSWYNIVLAIDFTNQTGHDRVKLYVNGSQITSFSTQTTTDPSSGTSAIGYSYDYNIGRYNYGSQNIIRGAYMAEINFIDGQALTPADFGYYNRSTGQWKAKKYTGTYGANGFLLEFKDSSNVGKDTSGNGNDWTSTGFVSSDNVIDSPHNTFATLNPLENSHPSSTTVGKGNLYISSSTDLATLNIILATIGMPLNSGKFYYEAFITNGNDTNAGYVGLTNTSNYRYISGATNTNLNGNATGTLSVGADNTPNIYVVNNSSNQYSTSGNLSNAIIGIFFDSNNLQVKVFFNNNEIYDGSMTTDTGLFFPVFCSRRSDNYIVVNFGQDATFAGTKTDSAGPYTDANGIGDFYYQPPAGALALCTQNIPPPAIQDPSKYFNSVTYTGTANSGTAGKKIKIGFEPDLIWAKDRFITYYLQLHDTVRGSSGGVIYSNRADTQDSTYTMQDFIGENNDGFTLGSNLTALNAQDSDIVAWCWKAGGAPSGTTATNGSAMIDGDAQKIDDIYANSTGADKKPDLMSVSTKAGFSIIKVSFSNTASAVKIPHGLSKAPEWVMIKSLDQATNWSVYHKSLGPTKRLKLNSVDLPETLTEVWNNTDPDQHVITIGNDTNGATNWHGTGRHIIYAWHSVPGYSAFGSYTANNSSDNAFVYTGFRPAWLMIRAYEGGNRGFMIWDNKRETFGSPVVPPGANPAKSWLNAQHVTLCTGEASQGKYGDVDILSNGFKIRNFNGNFGLSSEKHLWFAFAKDSLNFTNSM